MDCTAAGLHAAHGPFFAGDIPPPPAPAHGPSGVLCMRCEVRARCLGGVAAEAGTAQLKGILAGRSALRRGEVLRPPDDGSSYVHVVRRGSLKSTLGRDDGEQVAGFHLRGELVGVEGVLAPGLPTTVTALEEAELCALRFAPSGGEAPGVRAFLARLWDMISCELVRERGQRSLLAALAPRERVAAFAANASVRTRGRPWPMDARDVASYLRVAP